MPQANGSEGESSPAERLIRALPDLIAGLRKHSFDVGTEQFLAASDLILELSLRHERISQEILRPSLAGLFCGKQEEQANFPALFDPWFRRLGLAGPEARPDIRRESAAARSWSDLLQAKLRRYRWVAMVLTLLAALGLGYWQWKSAPELPATQETATPPVVLEKQPEQPTRPNLIPPPQTPAEPVIAPASYWPVWSEWSRWLWIPPFLLWFFWFLSRIFLRHTVLERRKQKAGEEITLKHLQITSDRTTLFSAPELAETWRHLRRYRSQPMRKLDEAASVARTLERGGYFTPVFRDRQVPPAYIALNDRRHAHDHAAGMMQELVSVMRRENLKVTLFDYHADPDYSVGEGEVGVERHPAALATVYSDHDLLLAGDGDTLFEPGAVGQRDKLEAFAPFRRRILLTGNPVWYQQSRHTAYADAGFELYPLTTEGIAQIRQGEGSAGWDNPGDLPQPRLLMVDPRRWLEERKPAKDRLRQLLEQLESYLGADGMQLLCATAGYPELNWELTRALDAQLQLSAADRELRLRRLSRLPWFRYGRIPDYLRMALLRHVDATAFRRISGAFHALLEHTADRPLELPYAIPEWQGLGAYWRDLIRLSASHKPLADRVFASVVRGRQPGLLQFALPEMKQRSVGGNWQGLVLPLMAGPVLLPVLVWLNLWLWQGWLEPTTRIAAQTAMQQKHSALTIAISAPASLGPHRDALAGSLINWGFKVLPEDVGASEALQKQASRLTDTASTREGTIIDEPLGVTRNQIRYTREAGEMVPLIAQRLAYLYFSEAPELIEQSSSAQALAGAAVSIRLNAAPRVFRDAILTDIKSIEPEMVRIPAGKFMMGSENGGKDERPPHMVTISRSFYLGKYEVTQEEFNRFTESTGRELPADEGWGGGVRPVINVSWEDAVAYAEWLSQQTGKRYRLPTEAEWEYAARAGTNTKYWWGDDIQQDGQVWANCDGCGSEWDGKQTAPVGSFEPNGFGISDTAGNVWEWVQDCWHPGYQGAPADGSAWLEADKGDCGRRVIRGGSWGSDPRGLRSADRSGFTPDGRGNGLGFRLAQDVE